MLKLSIIVPAHGPQEDLDNTLLTVLENRPPECEVLVPHPPDYVDPYDLSDEVTFVGSTGQQDLAALINAAVDTSHSDIIHVLLGGTLAREGWTDAACTQLRTEPRLAAIAPAILDIQDGRRLAAAGIHYGRGGVKRLVARGKRVHAITAKPVSVDGPLLQASFFRREVLVSLGGLRGEFGDFHIDTDLAARLRAAGMLCTSQPDSQVAGPIPKSPQGFHAARRAELLYWCHARRLRRHGALTCHGMHVLCDVLRQLPSPSVVTALLGRGCGLPQGLLGFAPSANAMPDHVMPDNSATEPAKPTAGDETISIHINEGRRRTAAQARNTPHDGRISRSA